MKFISAVIPSPYSIIAQHIIYHVIIAQQHHFITRVKPI